MKKMQVEKNSFRGDALNERKQLKQECHMMETIKLQSGEKSQHCI